MWLEHGPEGCVENTMLVRNAPAWLQNPLKNPCFRPIQALAQALLMQYYIFH